MRIRSSILILAFSLPLLALPLAGHGGPPERAGGPQGHELPGAGQPGSAAQRVAQRGTDPRWDERRLVSDEHLEPGRFTDREREIIREWLGQRGEGAETRRDEARPQTPGLSSGQRSLPPGLQMRLERGGDLPPGWQRKVERGEVLDSELIHRTSVSQELLGRLPHQPQDTRLIELEDQVVRVLETTGLVLDVLDILRD